MARGVKLDGTPKRIRDVLTRFWEKVDRRAFDECWPWLRSVNGGGYGQFSIRGRKIDAHRLAWILTFGPVPNGKLIRHVTCGNACCCNPHHLAPGTPVENAEDARRHGTLATGTKITANRTEARGVAHGQAVLTEQIVREIRLARALGKTMAAIGSEHGICASHVNQILKRRIWGHVS